MSVYVAPSGIPGGGRGVFTDKAIARRGLIQTFFLPVLAPESTWLDWGDWLRYANGTYRVPAKQGGLETLSDISRGPLTCINDAFAILEEGDDFIAAYEQRLGDPAYNANLVTLDNLKIGGKTVAVGLVALRAIEAGEEIFHRYGVPYWLCHRAYLRLSQDSDAAVAQASVELNNWTVKSARASGAP